MLVLADIGGIPFLWGAGSLAKSLLTRMHPFSTSQYLVPEGETVDQWANKFAPIMAVRKSLPPNLGSSMQAKRLYNSC